MKKKISRIASLALVGALTATTVLPAAAANTKAGATAPGFHCSKDENAYAIYPIPQDITYPATAEPFSVDASKVALVVEKDEAGKKAVDTYTEKYVKDVLKDYGIVPTEADAVVEGSTNIILGTDAVKGAADTYMTENQITKKKADLFTKDDAYLLDADAAKKTIVIEGKDTDGTFRGVSTLKMMFSSFAGSKLLDAHIEDFAGIKFRGFVEGFYGGWDYPSRESLMRMAQDVKMNTYVYAAKADEYHRSKWDQPYPAAELEKIRQLVEVGKETKCYYAWSVHFEHVFKGANANLTTQQRYDKLKAKFQQLYDVGVRKFDVLNDDFGSGTHEQVVELVNKLVTDFLIPNNCEPLTFCMKGYNKAWSGNGQELAAMRGMDPSVSLYWTGDDVNSPITQSTVNFVKEKTGHEACYWLNYPVNEHAKSGMFLGDIRHYARDGVTGLKGAVSNPSRFAESNKVALFQLASLFWNNNNYNANALKIWEAAFNYLEPEVREAYFTIAQNVANAPQSGRVPFFPESEYLKDKLESVLAKVQAGQSIKDDANANALSREFQNMVIAVADFKANCDNKALVAELNPWLDSLDDIARSGQAAIEAVKAFQAEDINGAWTQFAVAARKLETWDDHTTPSDAGAVIAKAGSLRLQPFAATMTKWLKNTLTPYMDPSNTVVQKTFYAKLAGTVRTDDAESAKVFDKDLASFGKWEQDQKVGDYFGVDLGRVVPVTDINIVQGKADDHNDWFHNAVLEYSADGEKWTTIEEYGADKAPMRIQKDGLNFEARYVRLRLTKVGTTTPAKANYWTYVRDFTVNKPAPDTHRVYTNVDILKDIPLVQEGKEFSLRNLKDLALAPGQYVGIKLNGYLPVSQIAKAGTGLDKLTFQYSANAADWTTAASLKETTGIRYVRLVNNTDAFVKGTLDKLAVTVASQDIAPKMAETSFTNAPKEGKWENMFDGDLSTVVWTNEGQERNDYIIVDLGAVTPVYDVAVAANDGKPHLYDADLQISTDKGQWTTIGSVKGDNSVVEPPCRYLRGNGEGKDARYIRILITDDVAAKYGNPFLKIHEIMINKNIPADQVISEVATSDNKSGAAVIDGDISSVYTPSGTAAGWLQYNLTEQTALKKITILQDASLISNAAVKVTTDKGVQQIGTLSAGANVFDVTAFKNVYAIRIEWAAGKAPSIFEIATEKAVSNSDDVGTHLDYITGATAPVPQAPTNLALRKPVVASGTENNNVSGQGPTRAVDGDMNTWWDSNHIKGANANPPAWIYVDLGKDSTITEISASYNKKVYPTKYKMQIATTLSNPVKDSDWKDVKTLTNAPAGPLNPTHTEKFDKPLQARYVRLYFTELNSDAAGHGVGLKELVVKGTQGTTTTPGTDIPTHTLPAVEKLEIVKKPAKLTYTKGEKLDLTGMEVQLVYADKKTDALGAESYKVTGFDPEKLGEQTITVASGNYKATFKVTVNKAEEPDPQPPVDPDPEEKPPVDPDPEEKPPVDPNPEVKPPTGDQDDHKDPSTEEKPQDTQKPVKPEKPQQGGVATGDPMQLSVLLMMCGMSGAAVVATRKKRK